jgi:divalent metal cation (Fe/Co/Zn/Cd) transporter
VLGCAAVMIMASFEVVQCKCTLTFVVKLCIRAYESLCTNKLSNHCHICAVSCLDLYDGFFNNDVNEITGGLGMYGILVLGTVMKFVLYIYCSRVNQKLRLDTLDALAEDHLNDVSFSISTS